MRHRVPALCLLALISSLAHAEVNLPRTMAWTAYNLGTTGYNQAVAIGKVLKDNHGVTLRVIPGKNDISRLLPLMKGRVQFSANGAATFFASEGMFQFAAADWGPLPLRLVMMSNGLNNQALAVTADSGIKTLSQLKGKRVAWVRGAPALNVNTEAMLACGGLTWDDVMRVDYPGYNAMWNGIVNGQVDTAFGATVSGPARKLEASPQGLYWLPVPHADMACWQRLKEVGPHFTKHIATRGATISATEPHEGGNYPYPLLTTLDTQSNEIVADLAQVIDEGYDQFKDADPGAIGWAMQYQLFEWVVPFHKGATDYFASIGVWTDAHAAHNERLIQRQALWQNAWQEMISLGMSDHEEFHSLWMQLRRRRLESAGFDPIWR